MTLSIRNQELISEWVKKEPSGKIVPTVFEDDAVKHGDLQRCPVCLMVPRFPMVFTKCLRPHMVCSDCFTSLFTIQLNGGYTSTLYIKCPLCRAPVQASEVIDIISESNLHPSSSLSQFYKTATVACSNEDCPEKTIPLLDINYHEIISCPYRTIKCPCIDCFFEGSASSVEDHIIFCPKKRFYCDKCISDYFITPRGHKCCSNPIHGLGLSLPYRNNDIMLPTNSQFRCFSQTTLIKVRNMVEEARSFRTQWRVRLRRVQRRFRSRLDLLPSPPQRDERPPRGSYISLVIF